MATPITWESFDGLLPDGDIINVTIEEGVFDPRAVEFRLTSAEDITWWKGLLVPDGLRSQWEIWTENEKTVAAVALWAHQVHNRQSLEFRKAKTVFAIHTGMYSLGGLDRLAPGSRVTFQWAQDTVRRPTDDWAGWQGAYLYGDTVDLSLPVDGTRDISGKPRFRAFAGQSFDAKFRIVNRTAWPPWVADRRYRLGSWDPQDNLTWGLRRVALPRRVPEADTADFQFTATAPSTPGLYWFSWRMLQEGVSWFGPLARRQIVVHSAPPRPPASGEVDLTLVQQSASWFTYDGVAQDPSISPQFSTPRHGMAGEVRNTTPYTFYLAHIDRLGHQVNSILLRPGQTTTAFAGLEVEGQWQAQYRSPQTDAPARFIVTVAWVVT